VQRECSDETPRMRRCSARRSWPCRSPARGRRQDWELSLRIVDATRCATLNARYRGKDRPTNVLSFPADLPEGWNCRSSATS
jgi:ssRNA-specific RNase YbeY (16S rRNA maturation enzyme)